MTALARLLSAQGYDCITAEEKERGRQFDAELLDLFFGSFDDVRAIRRSADTANAEQMFARALAHVSARARPARRHLARS